MRRVGRRDDGRHAAAALLDKLLRVALRVGALDGGLLPRAALGVRQAAGRVGVVLGFVVVECQGLARADAQIELAARTVVVRPKIDVSHV